MAFQSFEVSVCIAGALVLGLAGASCSRSAPPSPTSESASSPLIAPPAEQRLVAKFSPRIERNMPERLVAIGDLHGDLDAARRAFRLAGAIDEKDAWIGGHLVVVQAGDQIDRADDDRKVLDLVERLKREASKSGGEVIALSGNHELMNAALDFRYVTPGAFTAFADTRPNSTTSARVSRLGENEKGRGAAFTPGGPYAMMLAERPIFVKVGDNVFVHGGILPKHVRYGLDKMDNEVRAWLRGERAECPPIVSGEDGPVWSRMYSTAPSREDCAKLSEALESMGAKRMIMGHTVQRDGISPACEERAWRVDTGLSKTYGGKMEVLEIRGDTVTVRRVGADGG